MHDSDDFPKEVKHNNALYLRSEELGVGSFGAVYSFRHAEKKQKAVAMKIMRSVDELHLEEICTELRIWDRLEHEHIVRLLGYKWSRLTGIHMFIMEHASRGDLLSYIAERGCVSPAKLWLIACQLISAVGYIHSSGFVHCDIKPDNILLFSEDLVKLCDFGLARKIETDSVGNEKKVFYWSGTAAYFSPLKYARYESLSTKDDVWALGYTLLLIASAKIPWEYPSLNNEGYKMWLKNPRKHTNFKKVCKDKLLLELLRNMLNPSEKQRWTMKDAESSRYIENSSASRRTSRLGMCIKAKVLVPFTYVGKKMWN
uniref:Protein kinase domain-containing protein n=1 Tax=Steinernema glaseri TaxID=37863 RepID=A0A1I8A577_9BILA